MAVPYAQAGQNLQPQAFNNQNSLQNVYADPQGKQETLASVLQGIESLASEILGSSFDLRELLLGPTPTESGSSGVEKSAVSLIEVHQSIRRVLTAVLENLNRTHAALGSK